MHSLNTSPTCTSQVLSGFLAGAAALTLAPPSGALQDVQLKDYRDARKTGFDIIYEARDLDLDQDTRDGLTQARKDLNTTKTRVKESEKRIDQQLEGLISKNYWCVCKCFYCLCVSRACACVCVPALSELKAMKTSQA